MSSISDCISRRSFLKVTSGTALTAAIISACTPAGTMPTTAPSDGGTPTESTERGTLIPMYGSGIVSFNPITATQGFQADFFAAVMPGLMYPNKEKNGFVPAMAESWEISDDGLEYTFHIHPNATWHDGTPFTTADVEFTYRLFLMSETKSRWVSSLAPIKGAPAFTNKETEEVEGIQVIDDKTIKFVLSEPSVTIINFFGHTTMGMLPKHILGDVDPANLENNSFFYSDPVGSGPFKLVEYQPDQFIRLEANDDWHWGKPRLAGMVMQVISSPDAGQIALERGEVHFNAWGGLNTTPEVVEQFLANPGFKVIATKWTGNTSFAFNLRNPHWADKRVRQAWAYAIDRQRLIDTFAGGNGTIYNTSLVHSWTLPEGLNTYPYDPERAKQLLQEAGWNPDDEVTVSLMTITTEQGRAQVAAWKQMLEDVGFRIKVEEMDASVWVARFYTEHTYDVAYATFGAYDDPDSFLKYHIIPGGRYASGYADYIGGDFAEKVIEAGRLIDRAEREKIYYEINRIMNDNPWQVGMSVANDIYVFNNGVHIPGITDQRVLTSMADAKDPNSAIRPWWDRLETWEFQG